MEAIRTNPGARAGATGARDCVYAGSVNDPENTPPRHDDQHAAALTAALKAARLRLRQGAFTLDAAGAALDYGATPRAAMRLVAHDGFALAALDSLLPEHDGGYDG